MAWLPDYSYRQKITLDGSSTDAVSNYPVKLRIAPFSSWTANSKEYKHRFVIAVHADLGEPVSGYQVLVVVDTATLVADSMVNGAADGNEFEFGDSDGSTTYKYWMEPGTWDDANTRFWVNISGSIGSDYVDNQCHFIYLYYDPLISATSSNFSGEDTFEFFDDFSGDLSKWSTEGSPTINGSDELELADDDCVLGDQDTGPFGYNHEVRSRAKADDQDVTFASFSDEVKWLANNHCKMMSSIYTDGNGDWDSFTCQTRTSGSASNATKDGSGMVTFVDTYRQYIVRRKDGSVYGWQLREDTWAETDTGETGGNRPTGNLYPALTVSDSLQASILTVDWIFVRKFYGTDATTEVLPYQYYADVWLKNHCEHYPYDIVFTGTDATTQLYFFVEPQSLLSGFTDQHMEVFVKVTESIPQSGTEDIYVYYGKSGVTSWDAYGDDGADVFTFYDDFANDSAWTEVAGTWAVADVQRPIYKSGLWRVGRHPCVIKKDDTYYMFYLEGTVAGSGLAMPRPWNIALATSQDLKYGWTRHSTVFQPEESWIEEDGVYPSLVWLEGSTYYMLYSNAVMGDNSGKCGIASSTNLIDWTPSGNNPIFEYTDLDAGNRFWGSFIVKKDSTYYLFYSHLDSNLKIGYATCATVDGNYVDKGMIFDPADAVESPYVYFDGSSTWYMFYNGDGVVDEQYIGYATCADADFDDEMSDTDWSDQGEITTFSDKPWNIAGTGTTPIYEEDSTLYMFYYGMVEGASYYPDNNIGYATSTDWTTWTRQNEAKEYHQSDNSASKMMAVVNGGSYGNVAIGVTYTREYESGGSDLVAGIVCRYEDDTHFYWFNEMEHTDYFRFGKHDGTFTELETFTIVPDILEEWYTDVLRRLEVKCYGDDLEAVWSPHGNRWYEIFNTTDSTHDNTGVTAGLITHSSAAYFKDFYVRTYIEPEPSVGKVGSEERLGTRHGFINFQGIGIV